jgi:hypothetical protein
MEMKKVGIQKRAKIEDQISNGSKKQQNKSIEVFF